MSENPNDPHFDLRRKFREVMKNPDMLWGMEIEPYDLFEKDTRLPLASLNLANEEGLIAEACGRYRITLKGYDDDPRQPFAIPEVREWFAQLDKDAPYFMYFLEPEMMVVYAAAIVPHHYEDAELRFDKEKIQAYIQEKIEAIERFCEEAKVDPEPALKHLYRIFGLLPQHALPVEEFLQPQKGFLFAFELETAASLYGERFWHRLDLACLAALGAVLQEARAAGEQAPEVTFWGHLEEGFFGVFLAGDISPRAREVVTEILKARFPGQVLTEGGEITPTGKALPFWALRRGELMRCLEEDPEDGPALLTVAFDGEEWSYEAYEADPELLEEVVEPLSGIALVIAQVRYLD